VKDVWAKLDEQAQPVDPHVGPFPNRAFLQSWWDHLGSGNPLVAGNATSFLPLVERSGVVTCAGDADVTDYHSVRGPDFEAVAASLIELRGRYESVVLDSLPESSAHGLMTALGQLGAEREMVSHLPGTAVIDVGVDYLLGLPKKQRHELRRKRRRYEEAVGEVSLGFSSGAEALARFVTLHRAADGEKGSFFDAGREGLFGSLAASPGWEFTELAVGSTVIASLFGYRSDDSYYLYNSAFDPKFREVSPGIVALHQLIEHLVVSGCRHVDLLKGDETYKFRMGAIERRLYAIRIK
jgi:CelD/BcsL family acetyltransferase involved in cellulose biosynthesis